MVGIPALVVALLAGLAGGGLMFWFMVKVVWSPHENMNPDDYDVIGLLGVVSSSIREGGTEESCIRRPARGAPRARAAKTARRLGAAWKW